MAVWCERNDGFDFMWLVKKLNREIRNLRERDAISSVEERNWIRENWGFEEDKIARALQVAPFFLFLFNINSQPLDSFWKVHTFTN